MISAETVYMKLITLLKVFPLLSCYSLKIAFSENPEFLDLNGGVFRRCTP